MQMSIEGALRRTNKQLNGIMETDDGKVLTGAQARKYLLECLAKGWRVIPCGDCEGFDYQKGCPGHPQKD
jgi:hypothetical protein